MIFNSIIRHPVTKKWLSGVLRPAQHVTGHFRNESFQAITCTGINKEKTKHTKQDEI